MMASMLKHLPISVFLTWVFCSGCAIQDGRRYPGETVITHGEEGEMRVWGVANACVGLLPNNAFVGECSAPFTPIAALVGGIFDCVFFPFKWGYGEMTTPDHRRLPEEE